MRAQDGSKAPRAASVRQKVLGCQAVTAVRSGHEHFQICPPPEKAESPVAIAAWFFFFLQNAKRS